MTVSLDAGALEAYGSAVGASEPTYAPPPGQDELVAALRRGDERVFAVLVDEYGPGMLRVAQMYVSSRAVAEEVVQEAWLGVIGGIGRFEGRASLKTWIFRIVTNIAKTRGEREGRSLPFSAVAGRDGESDAAVDPDRFLDAGRWAGHWTSTPSRWSELPEERLVGGETVGIVERAIAALPEVQRTVITLRDVDGWSSDEVRNALDLSETNQRVILHRARSKVRRALEEYLDGEQT
jgi:RNA polymerase sigma-70 factor, ECF subfamily